MSGNAVFNSRDDYLDYMGSKDQRLVTICLFFLATLELPPFFPLTDTPHTDAALSPCGLLPSNCLFVTRINSFGIFFV